MAGAMANAIETVAETGGVVNGGGAVTVKAAGQNAVETAIENGGMVNGGGATGQVKMVAIKGGAACPGGMTKVGFLNVNADIPATAAKTAAAKPAAAISGSGFHLGLGLGLGAAGPIILAGLVTGGIYYYMKSR
ncbi:MAG: hypothetical protein HN353_13765 [Bdellovibrionales bacterium]|jgi:hypothetical protein|nr:hypothetical protein [Bdellovibrionales bacterium]MBT3524839.1 hypothetical protein [Bdellovibrionales bacterium]MBT7767202.1 hypothetical protein [Bdellovibrionales bacterium]